MGTQDTKTQPRMESKWLIFLFAVFAFAASLPSSSTSSSSSKATPSSSSSKNSSLNNSSKATCCSTSSPVTFETTGMGSFYQGERLGAFEAVGQSSDGRTVYKQRSGDNFLFFLAEAGVWMMGPE